MNKMDKIKSVLKKVFIFIAFFFLVTIFIQIPAYILEEYQVSDYLIAGLILVYFLSMLLTYILFLHIFKKYPLEESLDKSSFVINYKFLAHIFVFALIRIAWIFIYSWLFEKFGLSLPDNEVSLMESEEKMRTLIDFMAIVEAPIFEELLFRKLLMHLFFQNRKGLVSELAFILISSFIFAFAHDSSFGANFFLAYMISGLIYSISYRISKDVRVPILVHMISNLLSSL